MNDLNKKDLKNKIIDLVNLENYHIFGICLGMQVLFDSSEEGYEEGLGLIPGKIIKFNFKTYKYKTPHMGWNNVKIVKKNKLIDDFSKKFYFAHSFHVLCKDNDSILSSTFHGYDFPSVVSSKNIYGVQFHPEKSYFQGFNLIKKFIDI